MKLPNKLFLLTILFLSCNAFAGEDKLNAIMHTVSQKLHRLEITHHVHIGLSAIDTYNNIQINFNANQRFPMDSTSKFLKKSEHNPYLLQRHVFFTNDDIKQSGYSPITDQKIKKGMTVILMILSPLIISSIMIYLMRQITVVILSIVRKI